MNRVAILGCGPAGLLTAYAAHLMRIEADILSIPSKSVISGAQYLHMEIPMLTGKADGAVSIIKRGTRAGYAKKVYGNSGAECSWDIIDDGEHQAWSLRSTYETLWGMYEDHIEPFVVNYNAVKFLLKRYDLVFSTIPRVVVCSGHHSFTFQTVFFDDVSKISGINGNYMVYNGDPAEPWYRSSSIFGAESTEYSSWTQRRDFRGELREGQKPVGTDCDCHPGLICLGRFGQWKKGVLTHHAFQEACDALQRL